MSYLRHIPDPVSLAPGRAAAIIADMNKFIDACVVSAVKNRDVQERIASDASLFYDMRMSEILNGIEAEEPRDLNDLVQGVLFDSLNSCSSQSGLAGLDECIVMAAFLTQTCSDFPTKLTVESLISLKRLAQLSELVAAILPQFLARSQICLTTTSPYFDKTGRLLKTTAADHHKAFTQIGCPTTRTIKFDARSGRVHDYEGNLILDISQVEEESLRAKLLHIAAGLDDIIPPPGPGSFQASSIEMSSPEKRKRPRNPRGISTVKRLTYQVQPVDTSGNILLRDLLG